MDKRNKSEQFRKSKINFFKRGRKIGVNSDAEIFIWIRRKGKCYTFANTDLLPKEFQAIVCNIAI